MHNTTSLKEGENVMLGEKIKCTLILQSIGSILIIINGILVAINGKALIFSTFKANSVNEIMTTETFWGRVALGIPGLVEGTWAIFWLIFGGIMLGFVLLIYKKPLKERTYSILIAILSIFSIPIGGGFYIGAILAFIGGITGAERAKSFRETFFGRFLRALTLDPKLYNKLQDNLYSIQTVVFALLFIGFLSGIGNGLYTYNVSLIKNDEELATKILLDGYLIWNDMVAITAFASISIIIIKWFLVSTILYILASKLTTTSSDYQKIAKVAGFALTPEILFVILPILYTNEPTLSFTWPIGLYIVIQILVFLSLAVGIAQAYEFSKGKALGIAILGKTFYSLIYQLFIIPTLNVPGVKIEITMPQSSLGILVTAGILILISALLGTFSKR